MRRGLTTSLRRHRPRSWVERGEEGRHCCWVGGAVQQLAPAPFSSSAGKFLSSHDMDRDMESGIQVVLVRHGQSEWNSTKRFSGWMDIDLTETGRIEAARAGKLLKLHNFEFDEAHASVLKRAVRTLWTALHSSNHHWIPVRHTWRLNERHYGALTGLSKQEAERELGDEMLQRYRRGYDTEPLPMKEDHPYWTGNDRRYRDLGSLLPRGESLKQCKARILPYWYETVVPSIRAGRRVLIAAHNNVLRCLCKHLDNLPSDTLRTLEIPTGDPIVYTLNQETLEPMGMPDENGFRGKFLDPTDLAEEVNPMTDLIHVNEVLSLEMLQREARRLNLDLATIKCISEITGQMRVPSQPSGNDAGDEEPFLLGGSNDVASEAMKKAQAAGSSSSSSSSSSFSSSSSSMVPPPSFATTSLPEPHAHASTTGRVSPTAAGAATAAAASATTADNGGVSLSLSSDVWAKSAAALSDGAEKKEGGSDGDGPPLVPPFQQPFIGSSMADPMDDWVASDSSSTNADWWKPTGF